MDCRACIYCKGTMISIDFYYFKQEIWTTLQQFGPNGDIFTDTPTNFSIEIESFKFKSWFLINQIISIKIENKQRILKGYQFAKFYPFQNLCTKTHISDVWFYWDPQIHEIHALKGRLPLKNIDATKFIGCEFFY